MPFKFELGQKVVITVSGEAGEVEGRAEYTDGEPCYYVRYKAGGGCAAEDWWREKALSAS